MSLAASTILLLLLLLLVLLPASSFHCFVLFFLFFHSYSASSSSCVIRGILFRSAARAKRSCLRKEEAFLPARRATERRGNWFRSRTLERIAFLSNVYGSIEEAGNSFCRVFKPRVHTVYRVCARLGFLFFSFFFFFRIDIIFSDVGYSKYMYAFMRVAVKREVSCLLSTTIRNKKKKKKRKKRTSISINPGFPLNVCTIRWMCFVK